MMKHDAKKEKKREGHLRDFKVGFCTIWGSSVWERNVNSLHILTLADWSLMLHVVDLCTVNPFVRLSRHSIPSLFGIQ